MTEEELTRIIEVALRGTWDAGRDPERDITLRVKRGLGQRLERKRRQATQYHLDKIMEAVQAFNNGKQPQGAMK